MKNLQPQLSVIKQEIAEKFDRDIIPTLMEYIKIPNKSPMFDPDWKANGHMDRAMSLIKDWCKQQPIKNFQCDLIELPNRTPLLFMEIDGDIDQTVLLYGHMDKQPEMSGWDEDKGPWKPVLIDDKLYGRGSCDDGYAVFSALTAIQLLQKHNIPHARCIVLIEACEESGSYDLPHYLQHLKDRVGTPNLVITLDSGAANYEQLWSTTSLRGLLGGTLSIEVLKEGIHSGIGSGVVPSSTIILRQLLDRIENSHTGEILLNDLHVTIPQQRIEQAKKAAELLGKRVYQDYPFAKNTQPITTDGTELILNRTWRPGFSLTGAEGLPALKNAGNVTLPRIAVKLAFRLAPTSDPQKAAERVKAVLEKDPPFQANVRFDVEDVGPGWHAPELSDWLEKANQYASQQFFGKSAGYIGEGGSIPFMGMLGKMYPQAQFLITGVLGPKSNAHGPNEFLHIPMVKNITGCVASVLASHYEYCSTL